jgi:hypothetical protein
MSIVDAAGSIGIRGRAGSVGRDRVTADMGVLGSRTNTEKAALLTSGSTFPLVAAEVGSQPLRLARPSPAPSIPSQHPEGVGVLALETEHRSRDWRGRNLRLDEIPVLHRASDRAQVLEHDHPSFRQAAAVISGEVEGHCELPSPPAEDSQARLRAVIFRFEHLVNSSPPQWEHVGQVDEASAEEALADLQESEELANGRYRATSADGEELDLVLDDSLVTVAPSGRE